MLKFIFFNSYNYPSTSVPHIQTSWPSIHTHTHTHTHTHVRIHKPSPLQQILHTPLPFRAFSLDASLSSLCLICVLDVVLFFGVYFFIFPQKHLFSGSWHTHWFNRTGWRNRIRRNIQMVLQDRNNRYHGLQNQESCCNHFMINEQSKSFRRRKSWNLHFLFIILNENKSIRTCNFITFH